MANKDLNQEIKKYYLSSLSKIQKEIAVFYAQKDYVKFFSTSPVAVDSKNVEQILKTAWSGKNYSQRIWNNGKKLEKKFKTHWLRRFNSKKFHKKRR